MALRDRVYVAFFADPGAATRAVRQLWQAGYPRVRVSLGHARPGEPDLEAAVEPAAILAATVDDGWEDGPGAPARGEGGAWLTLVTTEDLAPSALRLLREAGGDWR